MPTQVPDDLRTRVLDAGYTPAGRDVPALLPLLADDDATVARQTERLLLRASQSEPRVLTSAMAAFARAPLPVRRALCALVGEIARAAASNPAIGGAPEWLVERTADTDGPTRRRAIAALGRAGGEAAEAVLLRAWDTVRDPADRRALATALGRLGGPAVDAALARAEDPGGDPLFSKRLAEARLRAGRGVSRASTTHLRLEATLPAESAVLLHVRAGLEELLIGELGGRFDARVVGAGRVRCVVNGPLQPLFTARTFLSLGFPLPAEPFAAPGSAGAKPARAGDHPEQAVCDAVAQAFCGPVSRAIVGALTEGPIRYRIHWSDGGKRKSATMAVAAAIAQRWPGPINDSTEAPWQIAVSVRGGSRVHVELWPKALDDPRFAYRHATLPASSHPTIAAALARVAGVRADDVVWDPFAGAGTELIERAIAGPYRHLYGTDLDARALDAARTNLAAAAVAHATVDMADARGFRVPETPTLILTNPPFGQRVPVPGGAAGLITAVLRHAAAQLAARGRLAAVIPHPLDADRLAQDCGLELVRRLPVDLGGLEATIVLLRPRVSP